MNIKAIKNGKTFWLALVVTAGFVYLSSFSLVSFDTVNSASVHREQSSGKDTKAGPKLPVSRTPVIQPDS